MSLYWLLLLPTISYISTGIYLLRTQLHSSLIVCTLYNYIIKHGVTWK
nr:MAG TPA: hypothetical protein [Crassvirales sp.]